MKHLFITASKHLSGSAAKQLSFIGFGLCSLTAFAQQPATAQDSINNLDEVLVQSVRATSGTPVTFSNITQAELAPRNLGQDIPTLLNYLPSVVTTTDGGNGIGYSSMRVRGSDASRINVTLNGIPYNDAESHGTYWVDMPDFASNTQSMQLQRGVGTSTNGAGAFGASLNLLTDSYKKDAGGEVSNSFGSYSSRKHTIKFTTGLLGDHFELSGRVSNIASQGYIDRAASNLKSYFLQGTYVGKTTLIKALVFGGSEKTYQAWNGIDAATLATDRRYNYSGYYTDDAGAVHFYKNETDNYWQDHYQLHWNERITDKFSTNVALHYTKGKGYYENYLQGAAFTDYGLTPVSVNGADLTATDLITRQWLDNDFYGTTFSANYKEDNFNLTAGGAWNRYNGGHYGNVIWAQYSGTTRPDDKYYNDDADKNDFNIYAKANGKVSSLLSLFADVQYRTVHYTADGVLVSPIDDTFNFFNPKAGLTLTVNDANSIYFSFARAHKEPRRDDYENGSYKPESLNDMELGYRFKHGRTAININGYYMRYKDQLVLTGAINSVGSPVYANSGDSYRLGAEIDATIYAGRFIIVKPNLAISTNQNKNFLNDTGEGAGVQNLGNTQIAFSPGVIAGNQLIFLPIKNFQVALLSKYVGRQYMDNLESASSKLPDYFINDINLSYELKTTTVFKSIVFSGLLNNIGNKRYISNGYMYGTDPYYYPQATRNFLVGVTLKF